MSTTTTANMTLVIPVDHTETDTWGAILTTAFGLIDAHDHTTGKGVQIPTAGIRIDADLSFLNSGSYYAASDLSLVDFHPIAATSATSYSSALFVNSSDANNLYFRNESGTNVKITDGNTINVSIVGGIGGDYASVGALLDYDDASDTYRLRQQTGASVRQFARTAVASLDLFEYKASGATPVPSFRVRLQSPAALGASYALTFPGTITAGAALQSDGSGVLSFSNTFTGNGSFTGTLASGTHTITGGLTTTTSIAAGTTISGTAITGTSLSFTTSITRAISASAAAPDIQGGHVSPVFNGISWTVATSTDPLCYPVPSAPGKTTIKAWTVFINKTSATGTITARLFRCEGTTGTNTALGSAQTNGTNNPGFIQLGETGLTITHNGLTDFFYIRVNGGGTTGDIFYNATVDVTGD